MNVRTALDIIQFADILLEYSKALKVSGEYLASARVELLSMKPGAPSTYVKGRAILDVITEAFEATANKFEVSVVSFLGEHRRDGEASLEYFLRITSIVQQGLPALAEYMKERGLHLQISDAKQQ